MNTIMSRQFAAARFVTLLGLMILVASFASFTVQHVAAQKATQRTFESPGKAAAAMFDAAKTGDTNALMQIFGPDSKELLASGDPVADKDTREQVVKKYEEMHRLVTEPDKSVILYIGAENWPFPIPIVEKNNVWFFDTAKGKQEVLFRRIGRNENFTIETLRSLVDAQKEYAVTTQDSTKQHGNRAVELCPALRAERQFLRHRVRHYRNGTETPSVALLIHRSGNEATERLWRTNRAAGRSLKSRSSLKPSGPIATLHA